MKIKILTLSLMCFSASAVAEVYSCGPGCYTSIPSKGRVKANLGNKIGSYSSVFSDNQSQESIVVSDAAVAPKSKPSNMQAAVRKNSASPARAVAHNVQTSVSNSPLPSIPKAMSLNKANNRRNILEQELNNERNALALAQKELAEGRMVGVGQSDINHLNKVRQLENVVLDRQQNIQALRKELGRM